MKACPGPESSSYQRAPNKSEKHVRNASKVSALQNGMSCPERAQEDETYDNDRPKIRQKPGSAALSYDDTTSTEQQGLDSRFCPC